MKKLFREINLKKGMLFLFFITGLFNNNLQIKHFYYICFLILLLYWLSESYLKLINKRLDLIDLRIRSFEKKTTSNQWIKVNNLAKLPTDDNYYKICINNIPREDYILNSRELHKYYYNLGSQLTHYKKSSPEPLPYS